MLIIEMVAHMDAGNRSLWPGAQDERPLSDLGRRQAELWAEAVADGRVDALFSSPALRCRETLAPLASRFGLNATVLDLLRESDGFQPPPGWGTGHEGPAAQAWGAAYAAGRAWRALQQVREAVHDGRAAVCTHGDVLPALLAFLGGAFAPPSHAPGGRGSWYSIRFSGDSAAVTYNQTPAGFPD